MIAFDVSKVDLAKDEKAALDRDASLRGLLKKRVEQVYESPARLVVCNDRHPFVMAAHDAFYEHRPLVISPDALWFCLAQGLAQHVNLNVERLRERFVRHEGQLTLVVERPDFVLGRPNPWPEVFSEFSDSIAAHVGKLRDLVVPDFSTTTDVARAAAEIALMDTFQGYFKYKVMIGCGIPRIALLGTADDWRSIRRRAQMFGDLDTELARWTRALLPVLDRIVETAEGRPDRAFWESFFQYQSGSGYAVLTGWIHVLFPYLKDWRTKALYPNPHLEAWDGGDRDRRGPSIAELPSGLASAPVDVDDARTGETAKLRFVGGMFGVVEGDDGSLAPELGWAIVYDEAATS